MQLLFTKPLRSAACDSDTRRRKRRTRTPSAQALEVVGEEPDLDAIFEEMELDPTQMDLHNLQRQEQEETDGLEAFVRSQLHDDFDGTLNCPAKRARHEGMSTFMQQAAIFQTYIAFDATIFLLQLVSKILHHPKDLALPVNFKCQWGFWKTRKIWFLTRMICSRT